MTQVDVTVVVPVFDTMPYLTATLDSLVSQSIGASRMHVVAVDDGSTDGSGEELERYAAAHPGLLTVVHQANSGGPAGPCNVGLDLARGRYVFFLGSDDYLGEEALERMVDRADEWGSDVLCGRMIGVNDRYVSQRLYREDAEDVPFPGDLLPYALSNTKLFRRALLEEHGIRYALDLRVGSDQPFTVEAMHHAGRISVLADYTCYYAVRRTDARNISYASTWRARLEDIGAVMEHIADLVPPGEERDGILVRHFDSELAKLLERDHPLLPESERAELRAGLRDLMDRYYTDRIEARLRPLYRLSYRAVRDDRSETIDDVNATDADEVPLVLDGDHVSYHLPERLASQPPEVYRLPPGHARRMIFAASSPGEVTWEDDCLHLRVPTRLDPRSAPHVRAALIAATGREGRPALRRDRRAASDKPSRRVAIADDGTLTWSGDVLEELGDRTQALWELRLQLDVGEHTYAVPVIADPLPPQHLRRGGIGRRRHYTVEVFVDSESRLLVSCEKQ
ncbi:glycosyltransferase family 2 protein [Nocardioides lijunqiniae]|uniref:glycosyltransferase family 2 protein n=1 Tax=Nocardioides lijunqiniae TaxID=2760832 RepID=UPI001878825F|nr:glycosyltransferase [Nocardioides lijunqiniae]